jgi:hypothetical protein
MAVTKQQARKVRLPVLTGELYLSGVLDGTTTEEIIELSSVADKITFQSDGNLAGAVLFSINGLDFASSTAFTANTMVSFNTHLVRVIKITRSSGSGKLHIVAL